jgi:hypothetical protein
MYIEGVSVNFSNKETTLFSKEFFQVSFPFERSRLKWVENEGCDLISKQRDCWWKIFQVKNVRGSIP